MGCGCGGRSFHSNPAPRRPTLAVTSPPRNQYQSPTAPANIVQSLGLAARRTAAATAPPPTPQRRTV
jgi:hypothetical protein